MGARLNWGKLIGETWFSFSQGRRRVEKRDLKGNIWRVSAKQRSFLIPMIRNKGIGHFANQNLAALRNSKYANTIKAKGSKESIGSLIRSAGILQASHCMKAIALSFTNKNTRLRRWLQFHNWSSGLQDVGHWSERRRLNDPANDELLVFLEAELWKQGLCLKPIIRNRDPETGYMWTQLKLLQSVKFCTRQLGSFGIMFKTEAPVIWQRNYVCQLMGNISWPEDRWCSDLNLDRLGWGWDTGQWSPKPPFLLPKRIGWFQQGWSHAILTDHRV